MVTSKSRAEILIVDDSRETLQILTKMLHKNGYAVRPIVDGQSAINAIVKKLPDLVLLDISMSGINGYEVCRWLKANSSTKHIPIIFISALDDVRNKVKAFEEGAVDYILKPFNFLEVLARIETHLQTSRQIQNLMAQSKQGAHRNTRRVDTEEIWGLNDGNTVVKKLAGDSEEASRTPHSGSVGHESTSSSSHQMNLILHNLRNPLHTITLTISLLKKRIDQSDPRIDTYLQRIERSLNEINHIMTETNKS